jgi:hypothetical protein
VIDEDRQIVAGDLEILFTEAAEDDHAAGLSLIALWAL